MRITVTPDDIWYAYEDSGDGIEQLTLCKYTPIEIDNTRDRHVFLNHVTQKHHTVYTTKLLNEFSKNPLDAAIAYKSKTDARIDDYLQSIRMIKADQMKALCEARWYVSLANHPEDEVQKAFEAVQQAYESK